MNFNTGQPDDHSRRDGDQSDQLVFSSGCIAGMCCSNFGYNLLIKGGS